MNSINYNYKVWVFSFFFLIVVGCSQGDKIPQEQFIEIILDIHKHSKASQYTINELTLTVASIDSLQNTITQSILDKHKVTREQLVETLHYYKTHTTAFLKLLATLKANTAVVNKPQVSEKQ